MKQKSKQLNNFKKNASKYVNEVTLRDTGEVIQAVTFGFLNPNKVLMILIKKGHKNYLPAILLSEWYSSGDYKTVPPNLYMAINFPHLRFTTMEYHPVRIAKTTTPIFEYNLAPTNTVTNTIRELPDETSH